MVKHRAGDSPNHHNLTEYNRQLQQRRNELQQRRGNGDRPQRRGVGDFMPRISAETYAVSLSGFPLNGKLAADSPAWGEFNRSFRSVDATRTALLAHIQRGGAYALAQFHNNDRRITNWRNAAGVALDFDDLTPQSANELLTSAFVTANATFAHTTPSHKPNAPRWRVLFMFDESCTDIDHYKSLLAAFKSLYPDSDPAVMHPASFFYGGGSNCELKQFGRTLDTTAQNALIRAQRKPDPTPTQPIETPTAAQIGGIDGGSDRVRNWVQRAIERTHDNVAAAAVGQRHLTTLRAANYLWSLALAAWAAPHINEATITATLTAAWAANGAAAESGRSAELRRIIHDAKRHVDKPQPEPKWRSGGAGLRLAQHTCGASTGNKKHQFRTCHRCAQDRAIREARKAAHHIENGQPLYTVTYDETDARRHLDRLRQRRHRGHGDYANITLPQGSGNVVFVTSQRVDGAERLPRSIVKLARFFLPLVTTPHQRRLGFSRHYGGAFMGVRGDGRYRFGLSRLMQTDSEYWQSIESDWTAKTALEASPPQHFQTYDLNVTGSDVGAKSACRDMHTCGCLACRTALGRHLAPLETAND